LGGWTLGVPRECEVERSTMTKVDLHWCDLIRDGRREWMGWIRHECGGATREVAASLLTA